jgi:predicted RNase H-like HicB family nuclease
VISEYLSAAMRFARVEAMGDGRYFATVPGLKGLWADGETADACVRQLRSVLEEWLVLALRDDDDLPELDGVSLNIGGRRWRARSLVESSSAV